MQLKMKMFRKVFPKTNIYLCQGRKSGAFGKPCLARVIILAVFVKKTKKNLFGRTRRRHDRRSSPVPAWSHPRKTMVLNHGLHPLRTMVLKIAALVPGYRTQHRSGSRGGVQDHGSEGVQTMIPDHGFARVGTMQV